MSAKRFRIEACLGGLQQPASSGETARAHAHLPAPPPQHERRPAATRADTAATDLRDVQLDLHAMKNAIAMTKGEIASLQRSATGLDGMHRAAGELDAVAAATEDATTTILGAVEEIESAANMLRASGLDPRRDNHVATILDRVILLYETCNFQDLTGQRIEKVVETLKFVEQRLDTMIAAWGAAESGPRPVMADPAGRHLVNGPGLPGDEQVSQSDIDAYFN
jgi:chemotaxis protein CheZ